MYEYSSTRTTLTRDLEWALTQANCFCSDSMNAHYVYYDGANNRYTRAAQCMDMNLIMGGNTNTSLDICIWSNYTLEIPGFVLSQTHEQFIRSLYLDFIGSAIARPYAYNGLHKNPQGNWVWYNYDLSEFPISYSDWAPGYPDNSTGDNFTAFNIDSNGKLSWQNFPINAVTQFNFALCQTPACTTDSTECCWRCNACRLKNIIRRRVTDI